MVKISIPQVSLKKSKVGKVYHSFIELYDSHFVIKVKYGCIMTEKDEYEVEQDVEKLFDLKEMRIKSSLVGIDHYYNTEENRDVVKLIMFGVSEDTIIVFSDKKEANKIYDIFYNYIIYGALPREVPIDERSVATEVK